MHDAKQTECIAACLDCYRTCIEMASNHCLERVGAHVEPKHFRTMAGLRRTLSYCGACDDA